MWGHVAGGAFAVGRQRHPLIELCDRFLKFPLVQIHNPEHVVSRKPCI
jgi:hypothetical protein